MAKVALVTGSAAGIGYAIATRLARAGYEIAVADVDETGAERAARALQQDGRRSAALLCDVGDRGAVHRMVEAAARALGDIDLLVNNAGRRRG